MVLGLLTYNSETMDSTQLPNVITPNKRITPNLFIGNHYEEWLYSAKMSIGGAKRLGYIDGKIVESLKDDPKYIDWESENMLTMNWILN